MSIQISIIKLIEKRTNEKDKIDDFSQNKVSLLSLFITAIIVFMAGPSGAKIADTDSYNYMAFAENQSVIVTIPKGSANPEVDM